jgi:hypothetical protein
VASPSGYRTSLNRSRLGADRGTAVALNLPLLLLPVPAVVFGALVAIGLV